MKKILVAVLVVAIAVIGVNVAMAAIKDSAHDFTTTSTYYSATTMTVIGMGTNNTGNDMCLHCHTPHGGGSVALWNRSTPGSLTTGGTATAIDARGSGTCLTCHDGSMTEAMANKAGRGNAAGNVTYGTYGASGFNNNQWVIDDATNGVSNDHPIHKSIPTSTVDFVQSPVGIKLFSGMVECATCHDPHNGVAGTGNFNAFIRSGVVCATCHIK